MRFELLCSVEGKPLVLVGKTLKERPPKSGPYLWSTDVTKLVDGQIARLWCVVFESLGHTAYPTNFKERRIGCCTFTEEDWKLIMDTRKKYGRKGARRG